jgi:hypothetical protein
MKKHSIPAAIVGAVMAAGAVLAAPGLASATPRTHLTFAQKQMQLETQLKDRTGQLARLSADVTGATSLTTAHAALLSSRLTSESASIAALVAKVPTDTTLAELNTDRAAMLQDNRVYAVMTPQVFETIEGDSIAVQVTTDTASEPTLQTSVSALVGEPGYQTALNHYNAFVKSVTSASLAVTDVETTELAQTPADFPGDTHIFVNANKRLLNADIALAHASYDASVIGLASGGYTGS